MKCDNCGKNEATCYYRSNINGNVTEKHLCSECADHLEENRNFFADTEKMFEDMFSGFFGRDTLSPWRSFGSFMMPTMVMPRIDILLNRYLAEPETKEETAKENVRENAAGKTETDPELSKKREINMLREEMKKAAEAEDFEKAAELRDKLREMEKNG